MITPSRISGGYILPEASLREHELSDEVECSNDATDRQTMYAKPQMDQRTEPSLGRDVPLSGHST